MPPVAGRLPVTGPPVGPVLDSLDRDRHTMASPDASPSTARTQPLPGARWALVLLLSMNLFNYVDRYILAAAEPQIRQSLLAADDPNALTKMGFLASAFLVTYMLISPLFGVLAERWSRWSLLALGVALWSLASGASGFAATFGMLLLTRCLVGVGEGAYGPIAPTVLSDYFPVQIRGRILAWFYVAIPLGSAIGFGLGGWLAKLNVAHESWRWAFWAVVPPGLLLALAALFAREPGRGATELAAPPRRAQPRDYLLLLHIPSYVYATLGFTAMTFAMGALAMWVPAYLEAHQAPPLWGIGPVTLFGAITALAGIAGTMVGGLLGDWLRPRWSGSYFLVSGIGLVLAAPCLWIFLMLPFPGAWFFVFLVEFFAFLGTGPTNTILANVSPPSIRATAFAANILIIHLFGDVPSPPLIGWIADRWSLTAGFGVVGIFLVLGGLFWLWGTRYLAHDTAVAPTRLS